MKELISIFAILILTIPCIGQYLNWTEIEESNIDPWHTADPEEYLGFYRFGDSEAESTLVLFDTGDEIIAQVQRGEWGVINQKQRWLQIYEHITNVNIDEQGTFTSDQYEGAFVFYDDGKERLPCLKLYNTWSSFTGKEGDYELGPKKDRKVIDYFNGKYIQASCENLTVETLTAMSPFELKIMRNEIFARYAYIFKKGGEMDTYFRQQDWYYPDYENVDSFLTEVEKRNIQLIKEVENSKINNN